MRRGPDPVTGTAVGNLRRRRKRIYLILVFTAIAGMLAACGLSPDWQPTSTPTAVSRLVPTPTEFVLSTEGVYRDDLRHRGATTADLASLPAGAILPPASSGESDRGVSLLLDNRTTIAGELYRQSAKPQPAIILMGAEISAWGSLPQQLSSAGFVVLVLQTDNSMPARHVDTVLQSLIAIPGVNAGAIGLIGEAQSADLAMLGCAVNSLCDALAAVQPDIARYTDEHAPVLWRASALAGGGAKVTASRMQPPWLFIKGCKGKRISSSLIRGAAPTFCAPSLAWLINWSTGLYISCARPKRVNTIGDDFA